MFARHLDSLDNIHEIAVRIHGATAALELEDGSLRVTASIGVCPLAGGTEERYLLVSEILQRADRAMYQAKAGGRGQTVFSSNVESPQMRS
ncbi:diguanylate cyclase (plasmid) [Paraburkholderia caribensis MBA4]|uniref:diguanylate cyclase n=1 Tax=Paraburkholderia caribensis MBA4 TaxID=1323664 RepID=A0A0P0RRG1_9BURK|nr:diguanylate cyclase [Paraburkholderia caribensis MBA4]